MGTHVSALPRGSGTAVMCGASALRQLCREMRTEGRNRVRERERRELGRWMLSLKAFTRSMTKSGAE